MDKHVNNTSACLCRHVSNQFKILPDLFYFLYYSYFINMLAQHLTDYSSE